MPLDLSTSPRSLNFVKAIQFTLPWETGRNRDGSLRADGGLHYRDSGKPTKYGIWKGANPDIDVENLTLDEAIEVYKVRYWLAYLTMRPVYMSLDEAEIGLAVSLFDAGVNCGVSRAWGWFLKSKDDSKVLNSMRGNYYGQVRQSKPEDYKGWMARLNDLNKYVDIQRAPT